jgi:hypothetical protein
MSKNTIMYLLLGIGAYYLYTKSGTTTGGFQFCQFPDGTQIKIPLGSTCPFDSTHGGQSIFLATSTG